MDFLFHIRSLLARLSSSRDSPLSVGTIAETSSPEGFLKSVTPRVYRGFPMPIDILANISSLR